MVAGLHGSGCATVPGRRPALREARLTGKSCHNGDGLRRLPSASVAFRRLVGKKFFLRKEGKGPKGRKGQKGRAIVRLRPLSLASARLVVGAAARGYARPTKRAIGSPYTALYRLFGGKIFFGSVEKRPKRTEGVRRRGDVPAERLYKTAGRDACGRLWTLIWKNIFTT